MATTTIHEFFRGTVSSVSAYGDAGTVLNVDQYGIYATSSRNGWKFARRLYEPFLIAPGRVVGDVAAHRPLLRPP